MPNFLSPFRRTRERETQPVFLDTSSTSRSDPYQYDSPRAGSRWRNLFGRRDQQKNMIYADDVDYLPRGGTRYIPSAVPSVRRRRVDNYSDSDYTGSDIRDRYSRRTSGVHYVPSDIPSQGSFAEQPVPVPFVDRTTPLSGSVYSESIPPPIEQTPLTEPPRMVTSEGVFSEGDPGSHTYPAGLHSIPENPMPQEGHRNSRVRERRAQSIPRGDSIRIHSDRTGNRVHYRDRRGSMNSMTTGSYISDDDGGYTTGSSLSDEPIIISADPETMIEIGNDRDGYIPYQEYLASRPSAHRSGRRHHRRQPRTPEEEDEDDVYIVPAGANVIFVDEDGRELHRVGEFDERSPRRRRNPRARTTRQADGSYVIEF